MTSEPLYEVVSPEGRAVRDTAPFNPFPQDLSNKTIGFVWDNLFKGPVIFDAIRRLVDARFPGVSYVDHEAFGDIHGKDEPSVMAELPGKIQAAKLDLAIVAVGA